jgi:tRNA (guanine26-N2/guanine27-N2)-dimethyltransferase
MISLKEYTEGRTSFLTADVKKYTGEKKQPTTGMPVFYNPRMRVNRDLSVIFLTSYMKRNQVELICEPLAGSGVRSLRYLNETPGDFKAILCDANPLAIETATSNLERYHMLKRARVIKGDAKSLIITESRNKRFDFVDIDPFGSPVPYLNAAVQSLNPRGGLLGATATDMPALCGIYPQVALRKYGGISTRAPFVHELAVRLLLGRIYDIAAMNDCAITPLAVLSTDHYIRVWTRIKGSKTLANRQAGSMGFIRLCPRCYGTHVANIKESMGSIFEHQREGCTGTVSTAGPLWIGNLFDRASLDTAKELYEKDTAAYDKRTGILLDQMSMEQDMAKFPYLDIHSLCDMHDLSSPKREDVIELIHERGYQAVRTHFKATAIRTDAPAREVVMLIRHLTGVEQNGKT